MTITEDIKYIGVNDHEIDLFEGQYIVPNGISYNSYAIIDDKNITDQDMRVGYNRLEKADFQYFGNNGNPEEAVGVVRIEGRNASDTRDLDIRFSFGAKK